MKNEIKEAKKKIELLTNHLLDSIDVDLLSDNLLVHKKSHPTIYNSLPFQDVYIHNIPETVQ